MSDDKTPTPKTKKASAKAEEPGFDARLERLETLVAELEEGDLDLETSIERYKEGHALLAGCRDLLERYRAQVEELTGQDGERTVPYDGDPDHLSGA
tara:strand:- start:6051 stop:6341 length:291 start_codon:yes stop_codon:yes gene_type:complete